MLVDDPYLAQLNLETAPSAVREWSSDLGRSLDTELAHTDIDPNLAGAQRSGLRTRAHPYSRPHL